MEVPVQQIQQHYQKSFPKAGETVVEIQLSCSNLPNTKDAPAEGSLLNKLRTKKANAKKLEELKCDGYVTVSTNNTVIATTPVVIDEPNPCFPVAVVLSAQDLSTDILFTVMDYHDGGLSKHKQVGSVLLKASDLLEAGKSSKVLQRALQGPPRPQGNGELMLKVTQAQSTGTAVISLAASSLPRLDLGLHGIDAYFKITTEDESRCLYISEVHSALSPWWKRFSLPLRWIERGTKLKISVFDQDSNSDDFAGQCIIQADQLLNHASVDTDWEIDLDTKFVPQDKKSAGKIQDAVRGRSRPKVVVQSVLIRSFPDVDKLSLSDKI